MRDITARRAAEEALAKSEARFRSLAASSPTGIYQTDPRGAITYVNDRWCEITGRTIDDVAGEETEALVHPDDIDVVELLRDQLVQTGREVRSRFRFLRPDGDERSVATVTAPLTDDDGNIVGYVGTMEDVTRRDAAEHERSAAILEATSDLVAVTSRKGALLYANAACREFFGISDENLADFQFEPFSPDWSKRRYMNETLPALRAEGIWHGDLAWLRDDEEVPVSALYISHYDDAGNLEFVSTISRDISDRKAFESKLEHQAAHDPLTGLPNRALLLDRVQVALARAERHGRAVAVLFLDLDHFKVVNDSLGHNLGDQLLVAAAERLTYALRPGDTVARFGGDEFVILCEDLTGERDATVVAERAERALSGPYQLDENEVHITVSTGIALTDGGSETADDLLRDADAAMYQAKERGRSRYELFDGRMRERAVDRLDVENGLRRALEQHELRLFFQPTVALPSRSIVGVEALLRWEHPERGLLVPTDFIHVAEEAGLMVPIGAWVLNQACRQMHRWQSSMPHLADLTLAVNLSARQLYQESLVYDIASVLEENLLDPGRIHLEITENVLMGDLQRSAETLSRLRALGVHIAVDNFGTGRSSLSYLRRFSVDQLKIDRCFVSGSSEDTDDWAVVAAIIGLADNLGVESVGEGVETADQLTELIRLGCDQAQGFHVAPPASGPNLEEFLAAKTLRTGVTER